MNFKKILVPLDGSKNSFHALDKAINLARQSHGTITGLFVIPFVKPVKSAQTTPYQQSLLKFAKKFFTKAKTRSAKNEVLFHDKIQWGNEGSKIISYSKNQRFDLIVIGSRGRGSVKGFFLGSTSNYVIHKSRLPVLVVK